MRAFVQRPLVLAIVGLAVVLSGRTLAQADSAARPSTSASEEPEDITIRGQRTLTEYRLEIERAREVVVGLFNELNSDDKNDITCRNERLTGTRMPQRVCRSNAANAADAGAAQEFLNVLLLGSGAGRANTPAGTGVAPPAGAAVFNAQVGTAAAQRDALAGKQASDAALTDEMKHLLAEHPDLYAAVVKLVELEDEYNEARGRTIEPPTVQQQLNVSIPVPAIANAQCGATATTEYRQANTVARVNGALSISDCAAASGGYTVIVRVKDESDTEKLLEFNETWQRSDDQDVKFTADYPIGENMYLMSTRIRNLTCTCAAPAAAP